MNFLTGTMVWLGTIILRGLVLKILWGWFLVPLGVMAITIPHALGFATIVTYLTYTIPTEHVTWDVVMTINIGVSLFILLFGYIFHLFM